MEIPEGLGQHGEGMLGVVGVGFDPTSDGAEAYASSQGWVLWTLYGELCHAGGYSAWEGQPALNELKEGDVVVRLPLEPLPLTPRGSRCAWRRACCSTSTRRR